jgi:RHS repeat-associated protein
VFYVGGIYEVQGGTVTKYYYAAGQRVAMRQNGAVTYLHGDHLGATSLATDAGGQPQARVLYYPYGEERYRDGTLPTDYTYTGQRVEESLGGLMDYNARYYDPALSRFVSADTIVPGIGSQAHNRYMYVNGNPLKYVDPSGHRACIDWDGNGRCTAWDKSAPPRRASVASTSPLIINLADYIVRGDGSVYMIGNEKGQERCQLQFDDGDICHYPGGCYYQVKNTGWEEFWVGDDGYIYRFRDTTDIEGGWYGQFTPVFNEAGEIIDYTPGARWAPVRMAIGDWFARLPYVVHYPFKDKLDSDRTALPYSEITLAAFYPAGTEITIGNGQPFTIDRNIIRLDVWDGGREDGYLWEQSYYAEGLGLIGFVVYYPDGTVRFSSWYQGDGTGTPEREKIVKFDQ